VRLSQLEAVSAERDGLYEDLINHRTSKRTVDKQWRIEREKSERLESELAFYQSHSARTLSDRDKVLPPAAAQLLAVVPQLGMLHMLGLSSMHACCPPPVFCASSTLRTGYERPSMCCDIQGCERNDEF
jgi:hypothetical protein